MIRGPVFNILDWLVVGLFVAVMLAIVVYAMRSKARSGTDYFLSGRDHGHIGIFKYDPATKAVTEVLKPSGPQIRSLAGSGNTGVIYPLTGQPLYAIYSYRWGGADPRHW